MIEEHEPGSDDGFLSDADRRLLRDSLRSLLDTHWPSRQAVARSNDPPAIAAIWRQLSAQGLTALGADPADGGLREIILVCEELGRASCPVPLLGAVAANLALAPQSGASHAPSPGTTLLDEIKRGQALVAAAYGACDGDPSAGGVTHRRNSDGQVALTGRIAFVEDAACATHFVVLVEEPAGIVIVAADAPGLSIKETPGLAVPAFSELTLQDTPGQMFALDAQTLTDIVLIARTACAARALGAAQRSFELAVDNAKIRRQFNQFIGQFQALQHKLADCLISLDGSRLILAAAADAHDSGSAHWRALALAALAFSGPAVREVAVQAICALGAIGYSEEHEAPRHFRRVHADLARLGGAPRARAGLAACLLGQDANSADADTAGVLLPFASARDTGGDFRREFRAWLAEHWTEQRQLENRKRPFADRHWDPEFSRLMGRDGWINIGWPKEYGGQARVASDQIAVLEELVGARVPYQAHNCGASIVARALFAYGTPQQKAEFLPAIARGERFFSLSYSEPEAGSDLASLRTRAVRDGDDWLITGQKLWSTGADKAEYAWLAARTDPEVKKHAGISVFMVNLRSPGVTIQPGMAMYGRTFSTIWYDKVRVPSSAMVGGVNNGWKVITGALGMELLMLGGMHMAVITRAFNRMIEYLRAADVDGRDLKQNPVIRDRIGALAADIMVARQLLLRNATLVENGLAPTSEAAISKVFMTELQERLGEAALDILGTGGLLSEDADSAPVGELEQVLRHSIMPIIGGGTNEIQRTQIALRGLGLPR